MNEEFKVALPKLGESIVSATIVQWFKQPGDQVRLDEPLLEVSTDKVNSEIPSPTSGTLTRILAGIDEEVDVGEVLALISPSKVENSRAESFSQASSVRSGSQDPSSSQQDGSMRDFYTPALLRLAREHGVELSELTQIAATGDGGRLTKRDLESYLQERASPSVSFRSASQKTVAACPQAFPQMRTEVERVKMSGMRKAIADNMVRSFYEAPHATLVSAVDVTAVLKVIQKEKEAFLNRYGVKLTITSFVARALSKALQEYPLINASLEQDTIILKRFVNLGIAVSVDQGLMVPVIKNCDRLSIPEIAKAIHELSSKARSGKLDLEEVSEGTITMTNFGMTGVLIGIPIIRHPEVAIVGVGAARKQVIALEDDLLAVRTMMHVSLTFDHRVLDGMYGCGFLAALKKRLEEDLSL
ncbi:MAG: dihydrolipoamide acetyltransferase family protein [Anaerolineae bacterium]